MSNQKPDQATPKGARMPLPAANEPESRCESLRASIARLQRELAARQAEARPMPSSVMRAYQKLIDRHLFELASKKSESIE